MLVELGFLLVVFDLPRLEDVGLGALDGALELELLEVAGRGDVTMVKVLQHILFKVVLQPI